MTSRPPTGWKRPPVTVASLLAVGLSAWTMVPAPTTIKYRVDLKSEQVVDLSAFNQGEQKSSFSMSGFLTVGLADTAGGRTIDIGLDSLTADSMAQAGVTKEMADSMRGSSWHGFLAANGRISGLKAVKAHPGTGQLAGFLSTFFPRVKPGAKVGESWTDTTDFATNDEAASFSVRMVTNYAATGTEVRNGIKALKIDAAFSSSRTGTITNPQGQLSVDGTSTGKGTYYMAPDGRFLGGMTTDNSDLSIVVPQAPQPIPLKATTVTTVTTLP